MIYDGARIVGATCCRAFVREKVCSIHGDTVRVGFGRMSITIDRAFSFQESWTTEREACVVSCCCVVCTVI